MYRIAALVLAVVAFTPSTFAQSPEATVRALFSTYETAYSTSDANQVASLYAEDASVLPPGHPIIQGRTAIRDFWQKNMGGKLTLTPTRIQVHGDVALVVGQFAFNDKSPEGKFAVSVVRKNGKWLIAVDMWNSDSE